MPYMVKRDDKNQWCVYTQDANGDSTGAAHGCHPTMDAAHEQMKALYANVPDAKEGKAILIPLSEDGDAFKIGDMVAFDGYFGDGQAYGSGGPMTTGSGFMGIIRAINGTDATVEYLDTKMQPRGDTCVRPLSSLREYILPVSADAPAPDGKAGRIEIVSTPHPEWESSFEYKSIGGLGPSSVNGRTVDGIAAVFGNIDDAGDITHNGAFRKTIQEQFKRVMFTFNHELMDTPRARIDELKEIPRDDLPVQIKSQYPQASGGLFVRRTYLDTPRGEEAFQGVITGAIPEMSYTYQAIKKDFGKVEGKSVRNLREVRLIDICDTTLGVNPATVSRKNAPPFYEGQKAAKDTDWDGLAEMTKAGPDDLKRMCAWVDSDNADQKSAYRLPYRTADGKLVWAAVKSAMAAAMGSRGGVDIPAADRKSVYDTLAKAYRAFDEEPPAYNMFEIALSVKDARNLLAQGVDFKAGRRNSAIDEAKIKTVIDALEKQLETLEDLLGTAEPPADEAKALTDPGAMLALLNLAEIELGIK